MDLNYFPAPIFAKVQCYYSKLAECNIGHHRNMANNPDKAVAQLHMGWSNNANLLQLDIAAADKAAEHKLVADN